MPGGFVSKRAISSITIAGQEISGGDVEINMPGATADPTTGEIVLPTGGTGQVETVTLGASEIANKYLILSSAPSTKENTKFDVSGLPPQIYGVDFEVTTDDGGKRVSWNGLGLDGLLISGDTVKITYS